MLLPSDASMVPGRRLHAETGGGICLEMDRLLVPGTWSLRKPSPRLNYYLSLREGLLEAPDTKVPCTRTPYQVQGT